MFTITSEDSFNSSLLSTLLLWSCPSLDLLLCGTLLFKPFSFSGSILSWILLLHLLSPQRSQRKIFWKDHHTERRNTSSLKRWSSTFWDKPFSKPSSCSFSSSVESTSSLMHVIHTPDFFKTLIQLLKLKTIHQFSTWKGSKLLIVKEQLT